MADRPPGRQEPQALAGPHLRRYRPLGIYSAIGQGGSWSLHRDDLGWFTDKAPQFPGDPNDDAGYQDWYYDQAKTFRGEDFDASEWAQACADAGMTYCVFTTKHHDGFCMYDSGYTNLKATSESSGLRRDILREVVDAFRGAGLETGAYFSKADWSHACYWDRSKRIHDRFHNYDLEAQPSAGSGSLISPWTRSPRSFPITVR
ncbi:alpha-L-fucosidase [Cutibacterium acnes JCM 18918]|nr:alpha-L-fucosidase [Cutibacterium acnes JCM 18918]